MREILFRGKRADNGEWVKGYYFKTPLTDEATGSSPEDGWSFLCGRERHCISRDNCVYEVIPETVGQYTGLCDKNGKRIFEGDILSIKTFAPETDWDDEIFVQVTATVVWDEGQLAWRVEGQKNNALSHIIKDGLEVIGDIHSNPELLEATHD